jgi:hypothetical protein
MKILQVISSKVPISPAMGQEDKHRMLNGLTMARTRCPEDMLNGPTMARTQCPEREREREISKTQALLSHFVGCGERMLSNHDGTERLPN